MAKLYARKHGTSVSATFSHLIRAIGVSEQYRDLNAPSGSVLEKISGILKVPKGQSDDELRFNALVEKHGLAEESKRSR
jgi:hypothetical protein